MSTLRADNLVEFHLRQCATRLEELLEGDIIFIRSPIYLGLDDIVRSEIEDLVASNEKKRKKLCVFIETTGGHIEVVERICSVFRMHYSEVSFIVPNCAYSAGTVLVLSGDDIYMDYYSVLGPIDPQIQDSNGKFQPGMGYLFKYNELIEKSRAGTITEAELLFLIKRFDPAEMFFIEQAKNHSKELIREWLVKYKFKNWKETETSGTKVTKRMKVERANKIAEIMGDAERWHSHGRGISIRELQSDDIKLKINDYGADPTLRDAIKQYYEIFSDYSRKTNATISIHTRLGFKRLG